MPFMRFPLTPKHRFALARAPHTQGEQYRRHLFVDPHQLYREHHTTIDPRGVFPAELRDARWVDSFDPNDRQLYQDSERMEVRARNPNTVPIGSAARAPSMEPIFDPLHNMRGVTKELVLLEDHLMHPTRRCQDCIRKHLVRAEAFAEEGISLDRTGQFVDPFTGMLGQIRSLQQAALSGDPVDQHALGQQVRQIRKQVAKLAYGPAGSAKKSAEPDLRAAVDTMDRYLDNSWVEYSQRKANVDGGYVVGFRLHQPLDRQLRLAMKVAKRIARTNHVQFFAVMGERPMLAFALPSDGRDQIDVRSLARHFSPSRVVVGAVAPTPGDTPVRTETKIEKAPIYPLKVGEQVAYAYRPAGRGTPIEGWYLGTVLPVGSHVGEHIVESIPQDGYVAIAYRDKTGGGTYWAEADEVVGVSGVASQVFARLGRIPRYDRGLVFSTQLNEQRLAMISIIESVLRRELGGVVPDAALLAVIEAAVINAAYESNLDPTARAKPPEDSAGLFQLNIVGAGRRMTLQERTNPILNTQRIAQEFQFRLVGGQTPWGTEMEPSPLLQSLVERAAAGDPAARPSVGEWTAAWTVEIERPSNPSVKAANRKRTADELFPPVARQLSPIAPASAALQPIAPKAVFGVGAMAAAAATAVILIAMAGRRP